MENKTPASIMCTCTDHDCPFHPTNHDKGCTPCIAKNLREREIPSCFFNQFKAPDEKLPNYHYEDFANLVLSQGNRS